MPKSNKVLFEVVSPYHSASSLNKKTEQERDEQKKKKIKFATAIKQYRLLIGFENNVYENRVRRRGTEKNFWTENVYVTQSRHTIKSETLYIWCIPKLLECWKGTKLLIDCVDLIIQ